MLCLAGRDRSQTCRGGGKPQWLTSWPVLTRDGYKLDTVVPMTRDKIAKFEITWQGQSVLTLPVS